MKRMEAFVVVCASVKDLSPDKKMKKDFELHFFFTYVVLVWNIADIGNYFLSQLPLQILCWTYL